MKEYTPYDAGKTFIESKKINYRGEYKPEEFWKEYGKFYHTMFRFPEAKDAKDHDDITLNLGELLGRLFEIKPEMVLEVGCGFGRCLPFVLDNVKTVKRLVGVEFSPTMIEQSKGYLFNRKEKINIVQGDAQNLPFKDNEFDVIYTHVCLTHIPPEFIPKVTSEISRVAKKWIVHIERFNFLYEHPNPHRWSHLLPPFYLEKGWKIHEYDMLIKNPEHKTKALVLTRR